MDSRKFSPPIQSIWIEEDQFMEKLYGFQVDQLLEHPINPNELFPNKGGNELEDKSTRILIVNSDTPYLANKSNITLKRTGTFIRRQRKMTSGEIGYNPPPQSLTRKLLKALRDNAIINKVRSQVDKNIINNSKNRKDINDSPIKSNPEISAPYEFQHISHGENQVESQEFENLDFDTSLTNIPEESETLGEKEEEVESENEDEGDHECDDTTATTIFSSMISKHSEGFSAFCTPRLNRNSVNSSMIFGLEKINDNDSLLSPTTLVELSPLRRDHHHHQPFM